MNVHSPYQHRIEQNHRLLQDLFLKSLYLKDLLNNYMSISFNNQTIQSYYSHLLTINMVVNLLKWCINHQQPKG